MKEELEIGRIYESAKPSDPFSEVRRVRITDIKDGYVQYKFSESGLYLTSTDVESFSAIYAATELTELDM